jgi:hypothetical protein
MPGRSGVDADPRRILRAFGELVRSPTFPWNLWKLTGSAIDLIPFPFGRATQLPFFLKSESGAGPIVLPAWIGS